MKRWLLVVVCSLAPAPAPAALGMGIHVNAGDIGRAWGGAVAYEVAYGCELRLGVEAGWLFQPDAARLESLHTFDVGPRGRLLLPTGPVAWFVSPGVGASYLHTRCCDGRGRFSETGYHVLAEIGLEVPLADAMNLVTGVTWLRQADWDAELTINRGLVDVGLLF